MYSGLELVKKEVETIKEERDFPTLTFVNVSEGEPFTEGSDLQIEIKASDGNGMPEVALRLRGLLLKANQTIKNLIIFNSTDNEFLKSMKTGIYHLEAETIDKNGLRTKKEINISAGDANPKSKDAWKDEIHRVILQRGEKFWDGDILKFPELNCALTLEDDGSLALINGVRKKGNTVIWANNGKGNRPKWKVKPEPKIFRFYAFIEAGQHKIKCKKEDRPTVLIYKTRPAKEAGDYKLGITAAKSLAVFKDNRGKTEIVWKSN